ncbi:MAG: response regulator, partial [Burkholderiales bacterium]|nr:response regulator [Burkholderiales bacterium]
VGLPDGTGLDFVSSVRRSSQVPAIALTGYGSDEDIRRCLAAGFTAHLTKPVNFSQLEVLIQRTAEAKGQGSVPQRAG